MRHGLGFATIVVCTGLAVSAAYAESAWFRMSIGPAVINYEQPPIDAGLPPVAGGNSDFSIDIPAILGARAGNDVAIPVTVNGLLDRETVRITGIPTGATVLRDDAIGYGHRVVDFPSAPIGEYAMRVEVVRLFGSLRAYRDMVLSVVGPLDVSMPQTSYGATTGTPMTIAPVIANVVNGPLGRVVWGFAEIPPPWIHLDEDTGLVSVDTSSMARTSGLALVAVDQADNSVDTTEPFSVTVSGILGSGAFANSTGLQPSSSVASNSITFSGFFDAKQVVASGATLFVNGVEAPSPALITTADQVALRTVAPPSTETSANASVTVDGLTRVWTVSTRDRTPAVIAVSPSTLTDMWADGESGTAYSTTRTVTVSNTGEEVAAIDASLANDAHFEIVNNNCATIGKDQSCTIDVRAKATATGTFASSLSISGTGQHFGTALSAAASLSGDALFPVALTSGTAINIASLPEFQANGRWAADRPKHVTIGNGIVIGSTIPTTPALRTGTGMGGTLRVSVASGAEVQAAGGRAGSIDGGTALLVEAAGVSVVNDGAIRGGGGMGGNGGNGGQGVTNASRTTTEGPIFDPANQYQSVMWFNGVWDVQWGGSTASNVMSNPYTHSDGWTYTHSNQSPWTAGYITRYRTANEPTYTSGGFGGVGGRGQGYDGAAANGVAGMVAAAPAANGATGGSGGTWGAVGNAGGTGVPGNNSAGITGAAGGARGLAISGSMTYSGDGVRQGL